MHKLHQIPAYSRELQQPEPGYRPGFSGDPGHGHEVRSLSGRPPTQRLHEYLATRQEIQSGGSGSGRDTQQEEAGSHQVHSPSE